MSDSSVSSHLAIRASAGSGKTYELTTRYLRVLVEEESVEPILATTFTRKAAGEILGRVLNRLAGAAAYPEKLADLCRDLETDLDQARCRVLLRTLATALHRVSISTLDSFFGRLARCFSYEAGLPVEAALLEGESPAALNLRLEALRLLLSGGDSEEWIRLLDQLHGGTAQRSVVLALNTLFGDLYEVYRQAPAEAWSGLVAPEGPPDAEAAAVLQAIQVLAETHPDSRWRKAFQKDADAIRSGSWASLCESGMLPAHLKDEEPQYYKKPIPLEVQQLYALVHRRVQTEVLGDLAGRTAATHELLDRFDAHYSELRRQNGAVLFSDVPHALMQVVSAHSREEITFRTDGSFAHLLLDEFQDTSPEQWSILKPFAQQAVSGEPGRCSFFSVGDVKQAIYGWRGGCAEIFDQLHHDLPVLEWQSRHASWRSSPVVLDVVNEVFSHIAANPVLTKAHAAAASTWGARFEAHSAHRALPGYVELSTFPASNEEAADTDEDPTADDQPSDHEAWVAIRVRELARTYPAASIGVLVRKNDTVRRLLFQLNQAGVVASGEGGSAVVDDPAVEVILSAFLLADHPGDTAAAFHVTAFPHAEALGWGNVAKADIPELARTIRRRLLSEGYAALVAEWAERLAPLCDPRGARRLAQLVTLAEAYEREADLRPSGFVRYALVTAVEEPSPARVRVMSIHRSKGLEFDLVVLPELHGKIAAHPPKLLVDRPSPADPIRAVYRYADTTARMLSPELREVYRRHQQAEVEESLCLLYVAMTRARQALFMFVPPRLPDGKGGFKSAGFTHAGILRAALASEVPEEGAGRQLLYSHGNPAFTMVVSLSATSATLEPLQIRLAPAQHRRSWAEVAPSQLDRGWEVSVAQILDLESSLPAARGTLIHSWLAKIAWLEEGLPSDEDLIRNGTAAVTRDHGVGVIAKLGVTERLAQFRHLLRQPLMRSVLSRPSEASVELTTEMRFAVRLQNDLVSGVFDRVVLRREAGQVVHADLTDFKTVRLGADLPDPAPYLPQLELYVRALQAMFGLDRSQITARLLFLDGDRATEHLLRQPSGA